MGGGTSALIPAFSPRRRRIIVRRPAKLGELEVRTVCGLTIRDTADCQSALLKQTGTSRFIGRKNQRLLGGGCQRTRPDCLANIVFGMRQRSVWAFPPHPGA